MLTITVLFYPLMANNVTYMPNRTGNETYIPRKASSSIPYAGRNRCQGYVPTTSAWSFEKQFESLVNKQLRLHPKDCPWGLIY